MGIELVIVWAIVLSFGLMAYVILDGMYLGLGVLLISARQTTAQQAMQKAIPFGCTSNVAWLILSGIGLAVAFPAAYTIFWQAFLLPLMLLVAGLLLRALSLASLSTASPSRQGVYRISLILGSILATFSQGAILGAVLQGVAVEQYQFVGSLWDWLTWFSVLTGVTLVITYALLGATWMRIMAKDPDFSETMRRYSHHLLVWVGYALTALFLIVPFLTEGLRERWLGLPNYFYMSFVPILGLMTFVWAYYVIRFAEWKIWPFGIVLLLLGTVYFTLLTTLWPAILPPNVNMYEAAAPNGTLLLALWASAVVVPLVGWAQYRRYAAFYNVQCRPVR